MSTNIIINHARQYGRKLKNTPIHTPTPTDRGKAVLPAFDTLEKGLTTDFLKVSDDKLPLAIKAKLIAARKKHV